MTDEQVGQSGCCRNLNQDEGRCTCGKGREKRSRRGIIAGVKLWMCQVLVKSVVCFHFLTNFTGFSSLSTSLFI